MEKPPLARRLFCQASRGTPCFLCKVLRTKELGKDLRLGIVDGSGEMEKPGWWPGFD